MHFDRHQLVFLAYFQRFDLGFKLGGLADATNFGKLVVSGILDHELGEING